MTLLEVLQLIGFSIGAVLPLWMGYLLFKQRLGVVHIQRLLLALGVCMVGWHGGNLVITLRSLFAADLARWDVLLRTANTVAVISITACYSLLLHVHIHLWATSQSRELTFIERTRIWLSYVPCLFLLITVPRIWSGPYQPMIVKLSSFVLPFALWVVYALGVVAITELLVARGSTSRSERRILQTLAFSFLTIAFLVLAALGLGLGKGTIAGQYLQTVANLGSLLPSALLVYYIYRYRFLELIIKESLVVATFTAVVLAVYVYGIRAVGDWASERYGVRAGVIEAILILALTLLAAPLRGWLEKRFRALFERETALYRDVVAQISAHASQHKRLDDLLAAIEVQTAKTLPLRRVKIELGEEGLAIDGAAYAAAYEITRDNRKLGWLLIESSEAALTSDVRAVLEVLAGQIAIAIEDCRLLEDNIRLERKVAEGERLAALGQMAATVAHEVKNPLSAIKSIAQVMCEDEGLKAQHAQDLGLIVGETDRLNKSVTQLLSFASKQPPATTPVRVSELVSSVIGLFRAEAAERRVIMKYDERDDTALDGLQTAALRDSLSNLILNALQVTPDGAVVNVQTKIDNRFLVVSILDSGPGIPPELRERIWEPFFTTRQRGTGLGLAIVRKRMTETGGTARFVPSQNGGGATFELRLPLSDVQA